MDGNECMICNNLIMSERLSISKTSSCCGIMGKMHIKCAKTYYQAVYNESNHEFDQKKWVDSSSIKMFCHTCKVSCLFCKTKKHILSNDHIKVVECTTDDCTHWSYYINGTPKFSGCISKAIEDIKQIKCLECKDKTQKNDGKKHLHHEHNVDDKIPLHPKNNQDSFKRLSKISHESNEIYHQEIHNIIYVKSLTYTCSIP